MKFKQTTNASAWGVCAAIAEFYGFTSPIRLFSSLGLPAPRKWHLYSQDEVDRLFAHPHIADDVERNKLFDEKPLVFVYDTKVHCHHLKVCKHCLSEGRLHNLDWQAVESTVCAEHHTPLIKSCAHMYADDSWNEAIRCSDCNTDTPHIISIPAYAQYMRQLVSNGEKSAFVSALKALAERMIRPFDFIPSSIRWTRLAPEQVDDILEDAFKLGASSNCAKTWLEMLEYHRSSLELLGKSATTIELETLRSTLEEVCWSQASTVRSKVEPSDLLTRYHTSSIPKDVIAVRNRYKYCQDPEDFSYLITGVHASSFLGVHPKAITELVQSGSLKSIHSCKQPDKQLFDIRDIQQMIFAGSVEQKAPNSNFISVDDIPHAIYELYDLTPEALVQSALLGNTESQIRINSTLRYVNKLQVTTEGLKTLLKQAWISLRDCPESKVAKMLRTNTQIVEKLVEEGFLSRTINDSDLITASSIKHFVDEYLLVNRKATFSQARNIAQKISSCCGAKPVFSMYMNPKQTDFVVFRKSELSTCCMQHIPKRFAHFATPRVDLSKDVQFLFTHFSGDSNEYRYF